MIVLNGNDQEFVATSSGCSTNGEYCKVSVTHSTMVFYKSG